MFRSRYLTIDNNCRREPSLADFLTARPSGLTEPESWAVLCQAIQTLQDLFLSGKLIKSSEHKRIFHSLITDMDPLPTWLSSISFCSLVYYVQWRYQWVLRQILRWTNREYLMFAWHIVICWLLWDVYFFLLTVYLCPSHTTLPHNSNIVHCIHDSLHLASETCRCRECIQPIFFARVQRWTAPLVQVFTFYKCCYC